jgi:hypothetical protein
MTTTTSEETKRRPSWTAIVLLTAIGGVALFLYFGASDPGGPTVRLRTEAFIQALGAATEACRMDNGPFPKNLDNHTFQADLSGAYAGRIYINFKPSEVNDKGELIDEWGTPFRIWYISDKEIGITSAGPDKTFGTADDITNQ